MSFATPRPRFALETLCLVIAAGSALAAQAAIASDWPRFRGPNGTGISTDAGVPDEIGEGKNVLWKVAIPGTGNASPIVSHGRIFFQTASEDGKERSLLCLDLADGKTLWSKTAPGATAHTHRKNSLASCSAAADGARVYIPFWNGQSVSLAAYDHAGNFAWSTVLGAYQSEHGPGHSPIVVGKNVIIVIDQDGHAEVIALDAASGVVAWRQEREPHRASYSTPTLFERKGQSPEILVTSTQGVTGYDPASGAERWSWHWASNKLQLRTVGSPIVCQDLVFFSGGNGPGARHAVAVSLYGKENGDTPEFAWETQKDFPYVPCMLSRGENVYFINDSGRAGCFNAKTGRSVWLEKLQADGAVAGDVTASPVMVGDRIYAFTENGTIFVFAADPTFKLISSGKLDDGVKASPAVADGRLIVRGAQHLYCFGTKDGKTAGRN